MAKPVHRHCWHLLIFIVSLAVPHSEQLQPSQTQTLRTIQQLLNYPPALSSWSSNTDLCYTEPDPSLTLECYEDSITQLHISGKSGLTPLPENFSINALFTVLSSLPSLKVLSLVSLGLWGPLPPSIGALFSLEILNLTSNNFNGSIPMHVSSLRNLQTLILDHNTFSGELPGWLSSLPLLAVLSVKNNSLSGAVPNSLSSLDSLRVLVLSVNHFSGEVPNLCSLTNLQVLDLEENYFGPHFPCLSTKLVILLLRKNRFRSGLPAQLSSYYQLRKLDLSLNRFIGPFLPALLSLPSLSYLDVAGNRFTGMLLENMSCNAELVFVNLSSNLLTGHLPTCLQLGSKSRVALYSGNCLSDGGNEQRPNSSCHNEALAVKILPHERKNKESSAKAGLALSILGGIFGGIMLVGLTFFVIGRVYSKNATKTQRTTFISENVSPAYTIKQLSDARYISETMKMGALGLPAYRAFSLEELKETTNNFDKSSLMAKSSHGQIYRGRLTSGALIAIRSFKMRKRHSAHFYMHQIELISKIRHCHLVSALGHCFECHPDDSSVSSIFLVFEFIPNGTLRGHTSNALPGQKLTWTQRIAAAVGVARGIQFLHTGVVPGVFANNLKITDILLDHNLHVKISCYNLPFLTETKGMVGAGVSSTQLNENFKRREKNEDKNDVYDLGVILLEIIVGRPIMSQHEVHVAKDLLLVSLRADGVARRGVVDPAVQKECTDDSLKTMMEICVRCMSSEPTDRPSVEDVLWNIQFAAQVQDSWRRGDSQSPQGSPASSSP